MINLHSVLLRRNEFKSGMEPGNLMPREINSLINVAQDIQAQNIFEFGTFLGYTALALAQNTNAHIWTIDLPFPRVGKNPDGWERHLVDESELVYRGRPEEERITQILADSTTYDYSALPEMDLVFVDGGHDPEIIRVLDSMAAFKLVKGNGVIAWHDFQNPKTPELTLFLNGLGRWVDLYHLTGTRLLLWAAIGNSQS